MLHDWRYLDAQLSLCKKLQNILQQFYELEHAYQLCLSTTCFMNENDETYAFVNNYHFIRFRFFFSLFFSVLVKQHPICSYHLLYCCNIQRSFAANVYANTKFRFDVSLLVHFANAILNIYPVFFALSKPIFFFAYTHLNFYLLSWLWYAHTQTLMIRPEQRKALAQYAITSRS